VADLSWVALSTLAPGTAFLTRDGRLGVVTFEWAGGLRRVFWVAPKLATRSAEQEAGVEVLPLAPAALADDLAELADKRQMLDDVIAEKWDTLVAPHVARERERCATVLEKRVAYWKGLKEPHHMRHEMELLTEMAGTLRALGNPPAPERCDRLAAEVERLRGQLPEGMQHCTIVFKECEKGHGRLTATNWVQHECQQCEIERLRAALEGGT
jgi:hypothetical protein